MGAEGIRNTKRIVQSPLKGRDAWYGEGVYFSKMGSQRHQYSAAHDCWPGVTQAMIKKGRLDWVVIVRGLKDVEKCEGREEVYVHRGDVNLREYYFEIEKSHFAKE